MYISNLAQCSKISEKCKKLNSFTNKKFRNSDIILFNKDLSKILNIPKKEILFYQKKKFFNSYNTKKNKFNNKISYKFFPVYFFLYLIYLFLILIFSSKNLNKNEKNKFLLIDNISSLNELKRYSVLTKTDNYLVRLNKNFPIKQQLKTIYKRKILNYDFEFKRFFSFLKIIIKLILLTIKTKINFFYLTITFLDDFLFYESFFKSYKFKFMISHQHYNTNNIKNYLLNKICGGKSIIMQKNIDASNQSGYFYDADLALTIGKKIEISNKNNSRIKKVLPFGSLFMEQGLYKKKLNKKKTDKFDILILGGNEQYPGGFFDNSYSHKKGYLKHLEWVKKLSEDFSNLKVGFKHHNNYSHKFEDDFFKDTNVKIVDRTKNSYHLAIQSKVLLSWASTMIVEMKSINKNSFYLSPQNLNDQFLNELHNKSEICFNNYEKLRTYIKKTKFKRASIKKINKNIINENYCKDSKNYSNNLVKLLKKLT